ncbi:MULTISPECIES: hypothetical protein [unclassified Sphingomonas]|uniref:carph-isopro domain-containing protein n=1 Tax=unclassified Sphingomonas TaxID=196159 RepID=UPI00226A709A|nr:MULTISPECIES: hypothetical protein [unclassified Sphingomonas]
MRTAAQIIEALGGSAEIARDTGFPLTTIESWKKADFIPEWRREKLLGIAGRKAVALGTSDFPARRRTVDPASEQVAA